MDPVLLCWGICGRKREMRSCKYMTEKEREGGRVRGADRGVYVQVHDNNVHSCAMCIVCSNSNVAQTEVCMCEYMIMSDTNVRTSSAMRRPL